MNGRNIFGIFIVSVGRKTNQIQEGKNANPNANCFCSLFTFFLLWFNFEDILDREIEQSQ